MGHIERKEEVEANRRCCLEQVRESIHRPSIGTDDIESKGIKAHSFCLTDIDGSLVLLYSPNLLRGKLQNRTLQENVPYSDKRLGETSWKR